MKKSEINYYQSWTNMAWNSESFHSHFANNPLFKPLKGKEKTKAIEKKRKMDMESAKTAGIIKSVPAKAKK